MKMFWLAVTMMSLTSAFSQEARSSEAPRGERQAQEIALLKFLSASPAVRGALVQIRQMNSRYKSCSPVKVTTLTDRSFTAHAYCNGSQGESETEWSEILTIEGAVYQPGAFHVDALKFDIAG